MAKRSRQGKTAHREVAANSTGTSAGVQWPLSWLSNDWILGLILLVAVILAYQPVWYAGFVWDDGMLVTANPCIIGPLGLKEIWTTSAADICPLTLTTFWVEHALWGLQPLPYHLVNVLLHGACAMVLWRVLQNLQVPGAWLGAALWALHPVQVESAAWISELKNAQSGLFYLLTILFFVKGLRAGKRDERSSWNWNYTLTCFFAALAMASKSSTVVLPAVLCLCAWWIEGRWHWRNLVKVGPIFLMSIASTGLAMRTVQLQGVNKDSQWVQSWPERLATAGDEIWFYLGRLVWPHPLMAIYPRWQIDAGSWFSYLPVLAALIGLFVLWLNHQTWARPCFFVFVYFLVVLLPVLGLVNHFFRRYSFVADHFQYLAGMGPLALVGAGLARFAYFAIPKRRRLHSALCIGLLLILGILSWQRVWAYGNDETLWTDELAKNPNCWAAYKDLGVVFVQKGQVDKAMDLFQKALEINPTEAATYYDLGLAFAKKGQVDDAIAQYQKALKITPDLANAHADLGLALVQKGQLDDAIAEYRKALEINPDFVNAHVNLGSALSKKGQMDEAIAQFQKALEINSNIAEIHNNLGNAFSKKGQIDEAIEQYQKALEINPNFAEAHNNLGLVFLRNGQADEAIAQFQEALLLKSDLSVAQSNLAKAKAMAAKKTPPR